MSNERCHRGSGNVYEDLGFSNSEEMQAKAMLASRILTIIEKRKWNQAAAAKVLGITQPKISLLRRGQLSGFSMEKLIKFLNKLNQDVQIIIKNNRFSSKNVGHISVAYA